MFVKISEIEESKKEKERKLKEQMEEKENEKRIATEKIKRSIEKD